MLLMKWKISQKMILGEILIVNIIMKIVMGKIEDTEKEITQEWVEADVMALDLDMV